mgnify:CR=1 FL=1
MIGYLYTRWLRAGWSLPAVVVTSALIRGSYHLYQGFGGFVGLASFLKTSGGKGLHVVVPLNPGCEWGVVKRFAKGFADAMATAEPHRFLAVATLKLRPNRIFIDYLRNGRGATAVASYSLRARERAPVALPIAWSELKALPRADAFTLKDVPARLKRRRKDPWAGMDAVTQDLSRWAGA